MKKLLAVSIALAALMGASARAADTSVLKTPVANEPPFAVYNWTGFYIGIQGGGGWARVVQSDARPFSSDPYFATGGMIGGTLGVNVQSGLIVLGLEADERLPGSKVDHRHQSILRQLRRRTAALLCKSSGTGHRPGARRTCDG